MDPLTCAAVQVGELILQVTPEGCQVVWPVPTMVAMQIPNDAEQMIARWRELNCPRIWVNDGWITNLERWLSPDTKINRTQAQLGLVQKFLQLPE